MRSTVRVIAATHFLATTAHVRLISPKYFHTVSILMVEVITSIIVGDTRKVIIANPVAGTLPVPEAV